MIISWKECENCVHNKVCSRKGTYEALAQKLQNIDKKKPYTNFKVSIECFDYKNNGKTDQYGFAVRV